MDKKAAQQLIENTFNAKFGENQFKKKDYIMKTSITLLIILLINIACTDSNTPVNKTESISEVEKAIDSAMTVAYDFWKFEEGIEPDFSKYNDSYTPNAVLHTIQGDSIKVETMKEGLIGFIKTIKSGKITYFKEFEIYTETKFYGNMGHRISYHVYYINSRDSVSLRAVNSIQIVNVDGKWLINTVLRQFEDENFPFPSEYTISLT